MALQNELYDDITNVYLNAAEFATRHTIDGIELICVVDDDRLLPGAGNASGVYGGERLIFVNASDLPGKPAIGARLNFDGKPWFVAALAENFGVYEIRLGANKT